MKSTIKYILFLAIYLFSTLCNANEAQSFWISSITNERFISKETKGPYIISFFFVGCIPCEKEIPDLYKYISTEFPKIPLLFIDPMKEDSLKMIKKYARKLKVPKKYFYKDSFGTIASKFSMDKKGYPTIFGVNGKEYIFILNGLKKDSLSLIKYKILENI